MPGLPLSALTPDQEKLLAREVDYETFAQGHLIYAQEISRVKQIYIVIKGCLEFYYDRDNIRRRSGKIPVHGVFGGLSILFNNHMAIHCLAALEETRVIALGPDIFLDLCRQNKTFQDYFALELGRCMADKTIAGVLARRHRDRELNLPFFNQPVSAIFRPNILTCTRDTPIGEAAQKMSRNNASAILVRPASKPRAESKTTAETQHIDGIVTDADIKKRAVARGLACTEPVSRIISSPVETISADCQVFEAFLTMIDRDKRHLAVTGKSGDISGIITEKDLIAAQTRSTFLLIKAVKSARDMAALDNVHSRLERLLLDPISNGASTDYITRLITAFSDAIIDKIIRFSIDRAGPPPCRFVFLTMGSEGREEQTLISDQDNAIIFEDLEDPDKAAKAKQYFDTLAQLICGKLNRAGYRYCEGNNMAQNPDWCQPMSVWKSYFKKWIRAASPEDLLHSSIFFDFRGTWGHKTMADELKDYLLSAIGKWSGFLRNMTENAVFFKPPVGLFGKFIVESKGQHKNALDIKLAILPIIDFTRIYALKNGITQTNTLVRLFRLYTRHALTAREYADILQSYNFLTGLRFRRQITTIMDEKAEPDNYINPSNLSSLDQLMLKEVFRLVEKLQQKLNIEFTGVV
ncbi:MAG: CBS domain-containing protein [Desulfobacter sp.]|nr:MAG: CBS domain-containing protein [Desulfobacter sp.]